MVAEAHGDTEFSEEVQRRVHRQRQDRQGVSGRHRQAHRRGRRLRAGTWGAVFDVYQDALAAKLAATFEGMVSFHASLADRWVDDENKAVPCGETFPREQPLEDNYESAVNRRVEALFFDPARDAAAAAAVQERSGRGVADRHHRPVPVVGGGAPAELLGQLPDLPRTEDPGAASGVAGRRNTQSIMSRRE